MCVGSRRRIINGDKKGIAMRRMLGATVGAALFVAGGAVAQSGPAVGPQFTLSGVVVVDGGGGRAWLQEPQLTGNQVVAVRPGESIGPYRLTTVLEDRVELVGPDGPLAVLLAGVQGPATASTSPPTPAAPAAAPVSDQGPERPFSLPADRPLAPAAPPGTPGVDFGSLIRGVLPR